MQVLIWAGAAITLAGLVGLVWCALDILRARRGGLDDAALRGRLQRAVVYNLGALFLSALGLMMVVTGVLLS